MSFARVFYAPSGTDYAIPFTYQDQSEVYVSVGGTQYLVGVNFSFLTSSTIRFSGVPSGVVQIRRKTGKTVNKTVFADTAVDVAAARNLEETQLLYGVQEAYDLATDDLGLAEDDGVNMDARTKRIRNVVDPTAAQDAATKHYTDAGDTAERTFVSSNALLKGGDGNWDARGLRLENLPPVPVNGNDATSKTYVDGKTLVFPPTPGLVFGMQGAVHMLRTSDSNNNLSQLATWVVLKPDGTQLSTVGTTTQGLQEAINYAQAFGYDLVVNGGGTKQASAPGAYDGQAPSIINCTTGITFAPMQGACVIIRDVTLNFTNAVTIGVHVDSMLASVMDLCWGGQIVMANANAVGVKFHPRTQVPQDSAFGIGIGGTCHVRTGSVVVPVGGSGICVQFDRSSGQIAFANSWEFSEPNGGAVGIQVTDGAFAFTDNSIFAYAVHGQTAQCVQIGVTIAGNNNIISGNKWWLDTHPAVGGVGVDTWGNRDYFNVTVGPLGGSAAVGLKCESTAYGNIFDAPLIVSCTILVQDLANSVGSNTYRTPSDHADVDMNGATPTISNATWTKLSFGNINRNTAAGNPMGNGWDGGNFRWIPRIPGRAVITAQARFTSPADQTKLVVAIYKNGTLMRGGESMMFASGAASEQGPFISRTVNIETSNDYFEIFVRQESGGNLGLAGDINETFATFTRLAS
jgi:hypothetical protein